MKDPTPERWAYTERYLEALFGPRDAEAQAVKAAASAADLPSISVSDELGALLTLLVRVVGARTAIEIGTLGGYSALCIARGLPADGRLVTFELDAERASLARRSLDQTAVGGRVRIEVGSAVKRLPAVAAELGPGGVDFAFIDADKESYATYWDLLRPLIRHGGMIVADNVLGTGRWWIDEEDRPERAAIDAFTRRAAADPDFDTAGILVRQGLLLARRK
ncbi:MAG: O-methyltransferase [Thermoanaerobaculia bacterium]|nr:O-methyltransferase [Thermoanaerobaculia bacterium]